MNFDAKILFYLIFESLSIYCLYKKRLPNNKLFWNGKAKHPIEKIKAEKNLVVLQTI